MDMQSNVLPFSLQFIQYGRTTPVTQFFSDANQLYTGDQQAVIELVENLDLAVLFECDTDENARLYMDGLEMIPGRQVEMDDSGDSFFYPSPQPYFMFRPDYFPLIPGYYQVRVSVHGIDYYALVKIKPKQISEEQWEVMCDEIEQKVKGLAQDLVYKNLGGHIPYADVVPPRVLLQFFVLQKHFSSVMAALSDLYDKVNFRIRKEYRMVPVDRAKVIDQETIRYRLRHPEQKNTLRTPHRDTNYDLPENRWVKKIVGDLIATLAQFIQSIDNCIRTVQQDLDNIQQFRYQESTQGVISEKQNLLEKLRHFAETGRKMRAAFEIIKTAPWYKQVSALRGGNVPHVMHSDSRYRALYQLFRALKQEVEAVELAPSYKFQWKRTDRLYEIWGFLQMMDCLSQRLGYTPVRGWFYDRSFSRKKYIIPTLPPNTSIVYRKRDVELHLVYDGSIPLVSQETSLMERPLFMRDTHNRPDGRLDVYQKGMYLGSLLFDFKYRPQRNIWDPSKVNSNTRPPFMRQLAAYGTSCGSLFLFDRKANKAYQDVQPVQEVWAIYPTEREGGTGPLFYPDHRLKLIKLSPNQSKDHIVDQLRLVIETILERRDKHIMEQGLA